MTHKQPVAIAPFRTSRADPWNHPRQSADISTRGKIHPLDRPATAFENALIIARIGLLPAVGLAAFLAVPITLIIMFGDKL